MARPGSSPIAATSYIYKKMFWVVKTAGTNQAVNDVICELRQYNAETGVATGTSTWNNETQGVAVATGDITLANLDFASSDTYLLSLQSAETLTIDATVGGVALTVPAGANYAVYQVQNANMRWTTSSVPPVAGTTGYLQANGVTGEIESAVELSAARFIREGALDSQVYVEYSRKIN